MQESELKNRNSNMDDLNKDINIIIHLIYIR